MKVAMYYSNEDVRIEELEKPIADDGEIVIKNHACGVCVADTMEWYNKPKAPIVLGHEATGIVSETGNGVEGLKVGDRVFVHHHVPCMNCDECRKGHYTLCKQFKSSNYTPGGFSEYFKVSPEHVKIDTLKLPDNVSVEEATLIEPLACAIHGIRRLNINPSNKVAVIGTGTIGLMLIETLKAYGISNIVAYETIPWRQEIAKKRGADVVRSPLSDLEEELKSLEQENGTNQFDKVCVMAKDLRAMELGMKLVGKGGTLLLFATPAPDEFLKFYVSEAFFKEMTITLTYSANHLDTREALRLIENNMISTKEYITHEYRLDQLDKAIAQTAGRGECLKCIVKLD